MLNEADLRPPGLKLTASRTFPAFNRANMVKIEDLAQPGEAAVPAWSHPELPQIIESMIEAGKKGAAVICSLGAHVIKCGLSRYLIKLMEKGVITHIAGNGAVSIHDFELAYLGGTSEYVPDAIEDGSFGMWEETGAWMNEAIQEGYQRKLGYGASLARYMDIYPGRFPHRGDSLIYRAYQLGLPATFHITIGTDIIHQHPAADFSALGGSSGIDFAVFCRSVSLLEGGVYLNFGSAVTGPEVFLKALSIARNQGYRVSKITTVNFDIIPLGDYRREVSQEHFHYYYRPRKNIVNRPTSLGGKGFYIEGNHRNTIPVLYDRILSKL